MIPPSDYPQRFLPAFLQQVAETSHLGVPTAYYRQNRGCAWALTVLFTVLALAVIVYLCSVIGAFWTPGIALDTSGVLLCVTLGLLGLAMAMASGAVAAFLSRNQRVMVYTEGLVQVFTPRRYHVCRWDEIVTLYSNSYQKPSVISLHLKHGKKVDISGGLAWKASTSASNMLADLVERKFVELHLPESLEQYRRGQVLDFGALRLSEQGLSNKKELVLWQEIVTIKVRNTLSDDVSAHVVITRKRQMLKPWMWIDTPVEWMSLPVDDFPNFCLFREVVTGFIGLPIELEP